MERADGATSDPVVPRSPGSLRAKRPKQRAFFNSRQPDSSLELTDLATSSASSAPGDQVPPKLRQNTPTRLEQKTFLRRPVIVDRDGPTPEREKLTSMLARFTSRLEADFKEQLYVHSLLLEDTLAKELANLGSQVGSPTSVVGMQHSASSHDQVPDNQPAVHQQPEGALEKGAAAENEHEEDGEEVVEARSTSKEGWWRNRMRNGQRDSFLPNQYSKAFVAKLKKAIRITPVADTLGNKDTMPQIRRIRRGASKGAFQVVHSACFTLLSAALIVANAVFIGVQTHLGMDIEFRRIFDSSVQDRSWDTPELCFLTFFTLELSIRIAYERLQFFRGIDWRWNLFDSIIVGISLLETVAASILTRIGLNFPFLRLVRVVRVLRVLKVLHMIPFFKRLGLMMSSVAASLSALAPAFVLLILVIYMFGICVMQGIINYLDDNTLTSKPAWLANLEFRFGSITSTMMTLFLSVTGGISWVEVLDGLNMIEGVYNLIYMFYVGFVQICVLNIVTGVFVDTVHQMYQPEREEMIEREANKRKAMLKNLKSLLKEADDDGSDTISWNEFKEFTEDPHIKMYLAAHEIDISQARQIFDLMECDAEGEVSIDEFVCNFMEFKGAAKGVDVVILRNLVNTILMRLTPFITDSKSCLDDIRFLIRSQSLQQRGDWSAASFLEEDDMLELPGVGGGRRSGGKSRGAAFRAKRPEVPAFIREPAGDTAPA